MSCVTSSAEKSCSSGALREPGGEWRTLPPVNPRLQQQPGPPCVTFKDSLGVVIKTVDQSFDYLNRWVRSATDPDGAGSATATDRFFIHEDGQIVLEFDGGSASELTNRYLWGPMVDQILADEQVSSLSAAGNVIWPLTDHLNTTRDLVDRNESTGAVTVTNHREFDSFGNLVSETNAAVDHVFGFTGRYFDEASGLQNNWNRWYDAEVGQWVSEDPIGFRAGDTNLRRYVGNRPDTWIDPSGEQFADPERMTGEKVHELGVWKFATHGELRAHLYKLLMRLDFAEMAQRGCVGIAMFRLGFNNPIIFNSVTGTPIIYPWQLPGATFFDSEDAAHKYAKELQEKHPDLKIHVIAWQEDGIKVVRGEGGDRINDHHILNSEVDRKGKKPENRGVFNFAIWLGEYWEYMNHGFVCPAGSPAGQTFPEGEEPVIYHSKSLPGSYDTTIYIVYANDPSKPYNQRDPEVTTKKPPTPKK
jgi:RHS repeat-associated protein